MWVRKWVMDLGIGTVIGTKWFLYNVFYYKKGLDFREELVKHLLNNLSYSNWGIQVCVCVWEWPRRWKTRRFRSGHNKTTCHSFTFNKFWTRFVPLESSGIFLLLTYLNWGVSLINIRVDEAKKSLFGTVLLFLTLVTRENFTRFDGFWHGWSYPKSLNSRDFLKSD